MPSTCGRSSFRRGCKGDLTGGGSIGASVRGCQTGTCEGHLPERARAARDRGSRARRRARDLHRSGPRAHAGPLDRADRPRLGHLQDQGRRRHRGRGHRRPPDRQEAPQDPRPPRLRGRDDEDDDGVRLRKRRQHRAGEVLQPPRRGAHGAHPRRRVDRPLAPRRLDPLPGLAQGLDERHPPGEPRGGRAHAEGLRREDGRSRSRARSPRRPDRVQLGQRARRSWSRPAS